MISSVGVSKIEEGSMLGSAIVPSNIDAEMAVIGSLLNNNEHLNKISDFLQAEHFYVPLHAKLFSHILRTYEKGLISTPLTLKHYLEHDEAIKSANTSASEYLGRLSASAAPIVNLMPYALDIYDTALRRQLIQVGQDAVFDAQHHETGVDASDLIERTEQKLFHLASSGAADSGFVDIRSSILESLRRIEIARKRGGQISGISTGYIDLDKVLGGLQDSDLLILAARPSMGKTSLAINIAMNIAIEFGRQENAKERKSVGVFSLEMSSEQIANRMISIKTGIDGNKVRMGNITKKEFDVLLHATEEMSSLPMYIDDTPAISIAALRTRARRLKRQHNLGLIVIDYLQLVRGTGRGGDVNRVQEIGEISQGLKAIAKELNIPVLALSQLSRAVESRDDKRPQLSDLRDSGNIEQDADVVMFIYREEYYLSRKMPVGNEEKFNQWQLQMDKSLNIAEVLIAKQRNGPIGNISLHFNSSTTGFSNLAASAALQK